MKNILIAVFAVLAAATVAGAEERTVNFDGKEGLNISITPDMMGAQDNLPIPHFSVPESLMPGSGPENNCCGFPMGPYGLCMAVCLPDLHDFDLAKAVNPVAFKELARFYQAQEKIKKAAAAHYTARNDAAMAAAFAAKDARITVEKDEVYLIVSGKAVKIHDAELAGTIIEIIHIEPQTKLIDPVSGVIIIVSCMQDEACWNAVGDGVSAVSQWWNS